MQACLRQIQMVRNTPYLKLNQQLISLNLMEITEIDIPIQTKYQTYKCKTSPNKRPKSA